MFTSYPSVSEIVNYPGLCFWNPTSLVSEAGYGTKLGFSENGISIEHQIGAMLFPTPESGSEKTIGIVTGLNTIVSTVIRNSNSGILSILFPNFSGGTNYQNEMIGTNIFSTTGKFLYVCERKDIVFLLRDCRPKLTDRSKLAMSNQSIMTFPIVFISSSQKWYRGTLAGCTL